MLEVINSIDTKLFLFINHLNSPVMDKVMFFVSYSFIPPLLILAFFLYFSFKKYKAKAFIPFLFLLMVFGLCDSISTKGFKDNIKRLRPMHEPSLMGNVYTAGQGRGGGKYGFVSSHATSTFGIIFFFFLLYRSKKSKFKYLFIYAAIVSYSRIYLGKHYPLDVICGALLGLFISWAIYRLFLIVESKWIKPYPNQL